MVDADVLMITHNRPEYTELALSRLFETCPEGCRIWLWHNGTDQRTLSVVDKFISHPRVFRFKHSEENRMLREPTNWFWSNAKGALLGKVDDDCLMPHGWIERLAAIHSDEPKAGALSSWPFLQDDYKEELAARKLITLKGGHKLLHNLWVGGSGYLVKRQSVEQIGLLRDRDSFSGWCVRLAKAGYLNGWPVPLLLMDHMDDPASPHTLIRSEADFQARASPNTRRTGVNSYEEYCQRARSGAVEVQTASTKTWRHAGFTGNCLSLAERFRAKLRRAQFGSGWKREQG